MTKSLETYLLDSAEIVKLAASTLRQDVMDKAVRACVTALKNDKPMLVCGNGGSAADAMHIAGELVARFLLERKGLSCICLSENPAMITAWSNDYEYETVFARQVEAYGREGAVLIGISTSGNSKNVIKAFEKAREMKITTVAITGEGGGKMAALSDVLLEAPSKNTPLIQQVHVCLYHYLCERIEAEMA
jgi:D-sedoheptulose 7-phosphate isomerase